MRKPGMPEAGVGVGHFLVGPRGSEGSRSLRQTKTCLRNPALAMRPDEPSVDDVPAGASERACRSPPPAQLLLVDDRDVSPEFLPERSLGPEAWRS